MLPADHLWPIDDVWNFHAGGGQFKDVSSFTKAQNARYGESTSVEQFAATAQLMTYEGERAMFEAYARNAPQSTGVIQWMLNNAWPSMIWHLYDYFLRPGGGYFGAKKACEPLHVQYSYDDRSIVLVNMSASLLDGATVTTHVLNLDMTEKFADTRAASAAAGSTSRALTIPELTGLSPTYFVDARLRDKNGRALSSNFYWLSTTMDVMDFPKSTWYNTPVTRYADFTALRQLPSATVVASVAPTTTADGWESSLVTLTNRGSGLAFFIRLQVKRPDGSEVLPVLWEDNFISLLPGETRVIQLQYLVKDRGPSRAGVVISGLNVPAKTITP
jgi:exo-1,4-beta-D-glucosaminidase